MVLLPLVIALSPWGRTIVELAPRGDDAPPAAVASDDAPSSAGDDAPLRPQQPEAERKADAKAAFQRGVREYREQRFEQARQDFEAAQRLAPHPDTLFNLAVVQQHTGRHVEAWRSFDELLTASSDEREREELREMQAASRPHVAWLSVRTPQRYLVCLDGRPLPTDADGTTRTLTTPGTHQLDVDRSRRPLDLRGGESRTVELETAGPTPPPPPRRRLRALAGLSIAGATAAGGMGLGAALVEPRRVRLGLGLGAAAMGTAALTSTIIALVSHRRGRTPPPPLTRCP